MKILILSENNSVFDNNSLTRVKILEYASLVSMLFVIVATSYKKKSIQTREISKNTLLYQTNSVYKFLHIWDVIKLASFELKNKNIFQPEIVISEAQLTSALAGYFFCRKFKRPLYISLSIASENKFFAPVGLKNFLQAKIIYLVLLKADCIQVDSVETKEKLRKKFGFKNHTIQLIKPVLDADMLLASSRTLVNKEKIGNTFIKKKFPDLKFTAVAFVDNAEQVRFSLEILKKINEHFPPISLILLPSYNIRISRINRLIKKRFRPFVRVENIDEDLCEYLTSANVFFGISKGEKYKEILSKACSVGAIIIAIEDGMVKKLIEDGTTGFICPASNKQKIIDYFEAKTLFLTINPAIGLSFKMNISIYLKKGFRSKKKEYLSKLKSSWKECLENYKKSRLKFYRY